ncbi:solute carrier family 12 member 8-like [Oscarella lobularis]|uniref:solute carrier family 12 member 8-like n=1 Tax=Oscarella lobularis TaxID=121494 RepID=UPI00331345CD
MAETLELEPFPPISTSPESTPASQRRSSGRSSPQIRVTAIDDEDSELLHEDKNKPWWKTNFFIREPIRFGTWDGVFTSCILNIFGVVIFLRSGWMVGQCRPWSLRSLDFSHSHVLGGRLGGVLGTLYVFGQAISISLYDY